MEGLEEALFSRLGKARQDKVAGLLFLPQYESRFLDFNADASLPGKQP